jgi:hypothetical protein
MANRVRIAAMVLGTIGLFSLFAAPVVVEARSIQRDGYFGGTWSPIGPRNNRHVRRFHQNWGPDEYAFYGPRYHYYDYGPRYPRRGVSIEFGF